MNNNRIVKIFIVYIVIQIVFGSTYFFIYENNKKWYFSNEDLVRANLTNLIEEKGVEKREWENKLLILESDLEDINTFYKCISKLSQNELSLKLNNNKLQNDSLNLTVDITEVSRQMAQELKTIEYLNRKDEYNIFKLIKLNGNILLEFYYGYKSDLQQNLLLKYLEKKYNNDLEIRNNLKNEIDQVSKKWKYYKKKEESKDYDNWNIYDFIYFAFAFINSADIIPNHTKIRLLIIIQRISELFLLFLIFNFKKKK